MTGIGSSRVLRLAILVICALLCISSNRTESITPRASIEPTSEARDQESGMPDTLAPRVPLIPPGTIVDRTAPEGWTHLIIKSLARMESGDIDQVPETVRELSGKFFVAI